MKAILGILLFLVVGGAIVVASVNQLNSDEVTCGGEVMSQGDICTETGSGSSTERTYDEEEASSTSSAYVGIGIGGVVLLGAVAGGIAAVRKRTASPALPAPTGTGQAFS